MLCGAAWGGSGSPAAATGARRRHGAAGWTTGHRMVCVHVTVIALCKPPHRGHPRTPGSVLRVSRTSVSWWAIAFVVTEACTKACRLRIPIKQSLPNSPVLFLPKPYLVLRDTLCSCEAYGMKPMHKKKCWFWKTIQADLTTHDCLHKMRWQLRPTCNLRCYSRAIWTGFQGEHRWRSSTHPSNPLPVCPSAGDGTSRRSMPLQPPMTTHTATTTTMQHDVC